MMVTAITMIPMAMMIQMSSGSDLGFITGCTLPQDQTITLGAEIISTTIVTIIMVTDGTITTITTEDTVMADTTIAGEAAGTIEEGIGAAEEVTPVEAVMAVADNSKLLYS